MEDRSRSPSHRPEVKGAELRAARQALGLSLGRFAALGEMFGGAVARSPRTVRRWEEDEQDIPMPVVVLVAILLRSQEARNLLQVRL